MTLLCACNLTANYNIHSSVGSFYAKNVKNVYLCVESAHCSVEEVMRCVTTTGRRIIDYFTYGGEIADICRYKLRLIALT